MGSTGGDNKGNFGMIKRGPLAKNIYNSDGKYKNANNFTQLSPYKWENKKRVISSLFCMDVCMTSAEIMSFDIYVCY